MRSKYITKIEAFALILLGGVEGESDTEAYLKRELHATNKEIEQAKEKLQELGLK